MEVTMPKLSDTMEEGKILRWLVKEGDSVSSGDVIAEIETDKADMEMEAFEDGIIVKIVKGEGESAPVGAVIAYIGEEGEAVEAPSAAAAEPAAEKKVKAEEPEPEEAKPAKEPKPEKEKVPPAPEKEKAPAAPAAAVKASPVARRLADAAGIDVVAIEGSGPDGRVVKRDIEARIEGKPPRLEPVRPRAAAEPETAKAPKAAEKPAPVPAKKLAGKRVPLSSMRKTIAKRLTESKNTIPHYYVTVSVDMGPVIEARDLIEKQEGLKLSINDFIIKACAKALVEHPQVNARLEGDEIVYLESVDIGVAVALEEGLITPVVRDCDNKSLSGISTEVRELAERARARKLLPEEYTGAGFSISNLGMFGVDQFTAIISPPEAAILAVGGVEEAPVVTEGKIVIGKRMKMTMSNDHRIVDGAVSAQFLASVKAILEHPMRMLV
jgi:pyruvate dehydrogenase E2 component (dihydrolipoamide acetyltransferase)